MKFQPESSIFQKTVDDVVHLTITRPEALNALNMDVLSTLVRTFGEIKEDPKIRAVVISGAGEKAFVAGADIMTMNQLGPRAIAEYIELGQRAMREVEQCRVPVIAAVNGYALGGGLELALACDIIIAAKSAKVGLPEVSLGIIPGFGGTQRLAQRAGIGTAKKLIYTGDIITAEAALACRIVDEVVEDGELDNFVKALVTKILSRGPCAVAGAKRVFVKTFSDPAISGLRHEVDEFLRLFNTADREEGMNAFLQKRAPNFKGR